MACVAGVQWFRAWTPYGMNFAAAMGYWGMNIHRPHTVLPVAQAASPDVLVDFPDFTQAVSDMVVAQQALGSSWGEAMGRAAECFGMDAVADLFAQRIARTRALLNLLDDVAEGSPAVANGLLARCFHSGNLPIWQTKEGGGDLNLAKRSWITSLPDALRAARNMVLSGCTSLTGLPEGLQVDRDLMLADCVSLASLPEGLQVGRDLGLRDCASLMALPHGLRVGRNLDLHGCTALECLPDDLKVGGMLDLEGCTSLATLPSGLEAGGWLNLEDCVALKTLPDGLEVGISLSLINCVSLATLPRRLAAQGSIFLTGCASWDGRIPDDARVGEHLYTPRHPGGITLEAWWDLHPDGKE